MGNIIPAQVLQSRGHEIRLKMKDKHLVTGAIFLDKIPIKVTETRELLPIFCKWVPFRKWTLKLLTESLLESKKQIMVKKKRNHSCSQIEGPDSRWIFRNLTLFISLSPFTSGVDWAPSRCGRSCLAFPSCPGLIASSPVHPSCTLIRGMWHETRGLWVERCDVHQFQSHP